MPDSLQFYTRPASFNMDLQQLRILLPLILFSHLCQKFNAYSIEEKSPDRISSPIFPSQLDKGARGARLSLLVGQSDVVNVDAFGAKGDGSSDDTKPFVDAWKAACSSSTTASILIPEDKVYFVKPITFAGPCKSKIVVLVKGTVLASSDISDYAVTGNQNWISFSRLDNLRIEGGGTFDGNGHIWWKNSCKIDTSLPCKRAPTAVAFQTCTNLEVSHLNFKNSQWVHVSFENSEDVQVSSLSIFAPETSPNTDGIHVSRTKNIHIDGCVIKTGDDCIGIITGSQFVNITNTNCGPGHGISVGSLGAGGTEETVSDVHVDTAHLEGTENGVRIKTWQGGRGYAKQITFENVIMNNVKNPIIIDQHYSDSPDSRSCTIQESRVEISGVTYKNITGTSRSLSAMVFNCDEAVPCRGILLQDIDLTMEGGASAKTTCHNVVFSTSGTVVPRPCAPPEYTKRY